MDENDRCAALVLAFWKLSQPSTNLTEQGAIELYDQCLEKVRKHRSRKDASERPEEN
jgi:hypothetical protein